MKMRPAHFLYLVIFAALCWGGAAQTQTQSAPATPAQTPPAAPVVTARPGDVDSVDHIIAATYDVISGPAGPRDWDRFRSFFYPGARLMPSGRDDKGTISARVLTPDEYATRGSQYFSKEGFFERSIANKAELWDHLAHVWSTYESRHAKDDAQPFARGINSFQLIHDGKRWWILSIYWEAEDKDHQLPEKYTK